MKNILFLRNNLIVLFTILLFLTACIKKEEKIIIACASNLIDIFPVLIEEYELLNGEIDLSVSYGSSGSLATQIINGAPYSIFYSADLFKANRVKENLGLDKNVDVYCKGKLILFSRTNRITETMDYSKINSSKIVIANPDLAPYGMAAQEFISSVDIDMDNNELIIAENIGQAIHYSLNGCDYGFIPKSALNKNEIKRLLELNESSWILLDEEFYSPINQGSLLLTDNEQVKGFYDFILSDKAVKIFEEFGYSGG